ncbi:MULTISPECIES: cytochrome P450 [Pseudofrankia]|uniref:cytochrome P450 n=1 Tax=Pseudofrankia TaxID=2994363 RepID=UPI000234CA7D|nr:MULTISPECIES: cytochrome P450 [Pseudofrankia]OHV39167.1 cytochrome [Pseudofrankia sp. EUN1h]
MTAATDIYYDPYDFAIDENPYPVWKRMREEAPLYYNERYDFYAVSRYVDVEALSVDWQTYTSSKGILMEMVKAGIPTPPGLFIAEDPPEHDMHRLLLSRAVTPKRVLVLENRIRELCAEYLDPLVGSSRFDLMQDFASQLPMRVIGALVGIPDEYLLNLRDHVEESARLKEEKPQDSQRLPSIGEPYAPFLEYKKSHPDDDFLTTLIQVRFKDVLTGEERGLTDAEILNYVGMLYAAGVETTARLIGWFGKTLADNPDQRALVVADRSLVKNTIEETLRYEVPSPIQVRVTTRPVELHGQTVDAGKIITLMTGAANRDPAAFPDPDTFDIRRKMDAHMTFGKGVHYCFGAALARIEGRIALEEILDRFPKWDLDLSGAELIHTATIRGYHKLPVVL